MTLRTSIASLTGVALLLLAGPAAANPLPEGFAGLYSEDLLHPDAVARELDARGMQAAGARLVRLPFYWDRIERAPGAYRFKTYDDVLAAASRNGLDVLPVLVRPPSFRAQHAERADRSPPADPGAAAALATKLVDRYGPSGSFWREHPELPVRPVSAWQVWNEPNLPQWWHPRPDPAAYRELLNTTSLAIHRADPTAEVVLAGIVDSPLGMPPSAFVADLHAAPASYDTYALHPYAASPRGVLDQIRSARTFLGGLGRHTTPIRITEFGWGSSGRPGPLTTDAAGQAERLRTTVGALVAERAALRLRGVVYYTWRDATAHGDDETWSSRAGLLDRDFGAKPALLAYRDAFAGLKTADAIESGSAGADPQAQSRESPAGCRVTLRRRRTATSLLRNGLRVRAVCGPGSSAVSLTVTRKVGPRLRTVSRGRVRGGFAALRVNRRRLGPPPGTLLVRATAAGRRPATQWLAVSR